MRSFIKIEKEFISFLVRSDRGQRNVMCFLDKHLEKTVLRLNFKNNTGEYLFEAKEATDEVFGWVISKIEDLQELIAVISNLIVYLKNNGYIAHYSVTPNKWSQVHDFGQGVQDDLKIPSPFPDEDIVKLLIEYAFKEIVPLEPLIDLEKHEFISQEERRFTKQYNQTQESIRHAKNGVAIAIVIGVAGVFFNIYSLNKQSESSAVNANLYKESTDIVVGSFNKLTNIVQDRNRKLDNLLKEGQSSSFLLEKKLEEIRNEVKTMNKNYMEQIKNGHNKQIQPTQKPRS